MLARIPKLLQTTIALAIVLGPSPASAQVDPFSWPTSGQVIPENGFADPVAANCDGSCNGQCNRCVTNGKWIYGVDQNTTRGLSREPRWKDQKLVPWESMAYGEYIGPYRTPHMPEYRLRISDEVDVNYMISRRPDGSPYRIFPGDTISITSVGDPSSNQPSLLVLSDGTVSLPLVGTVSVAGKTVERLKEELNRLYQENKVRDPRINVQVIKGDTPQEDLRLAVVANFGANGQSRRALVTADGTIQLPVIGSVPAIGLTLDEVSREISARYEMANLKGVNAQALLVSQAPASIWVLGQVNQPRRIEANGPITVIQAIAEAGGWLPGGNLRQVIVFRRDENWQLIATKLDLQGALNGRRPFPSDEIWLRNQDIVIVPRSPIQRFSEAVNLYAGTLYSIFPQQGVTFSFDNFTLFDNN